MVLQTACPAGSFTLFSWIYHSGTCLNNDQPESNRIPNLVTTKIMQTRAVLTSGIQPLNTPMRKGLLAPHIILRGIISYPYPNHISTPQYMKNMFHVKSRMNQLYLYIVKLTLFCKCHYIYTYIYIHQIHLVYITFHRIIVHDFPHIWHLNWQDSVALPGMHASNAVLF